ncbi:MAG: tRNA (adenosine(37)-N6)-dimethylallyltransferase MiaA [Campylobacterota bacterium]|nr:tRNA (adenosine(37)-N6)-dimethylallyltransferase MiaA [Campylobacterota bacterium]
MKTIQQLAIIGATASGKSGASIEIASKLDAYILSLDSLSIYKEIDIASAKPTLEERQGIPHFGIDVFYPNQAFDVTEFIKLYQEAYSKALEDNKALVIVGGSSFYLKILIEGISKLPTISQESKNKTQERLKDLSSSYAILYALDQKYMQNIALTDRYRIEKVLDIYHETNLAPSHYFSQNSPQPIIQGELPIYSIATNRQVLRERIKLRTYQMIKQGILDEVCYLEKKYTRTPNPMKSIGIKETLDYLDGRYNKNIMIEKIITNTARLAKRQSTFNNSQFEDKIVVTLEELSKLASNDTLKKL